MSENKQQQQKKENDDPLSKYILTQTKYFSKTVSQTVLNLAELFNWTFIIVNSVKRPKDKSRMTFT